MLRFEKVTAFFVIMTLIFSLIGCGEGSGKNNGKVDGENYVFAEMKYENDRQVFYNNGKPYLFNPVHFRYDHLLRATTNPDKALEDGMRLIKENGWNAVMLYVYWEEVFDGKNHDFSYLKKQFDLAVKYDLNVHIVWFGSNICGYGGYQSWQTDYKKYPSLKDEYGNYVLGTGYADGERIPDFSADIYGQEEAASITALCDWLYENDKDRRTVAIQLQDEPDNSEGGNGQWMSQFKSYADHLEKLGKAVKESRYSMITYVNIMSDGYNDTLDGMNFKQRAAYVFEKPNIDFIGYSLYNNDTSPRMKDIEQDGNHPVFVGLGVSSYAVPAQHLFALSNGYGVCAYQLINLIGSDHGFYKQNGTMEEGTIYGIRDGKENLNSELFEQALEVNKTDVVNMNSSLKKLGELIAVTNPEFMKVYNNQLKNDATSTKSVDKEKIKYVVKTADQYGGVGLVLKANDGNFYLITTKEAKMIFESNITVTEGSYKDGRWISDGEVSVKDNCFTVSAAKAYQIVVK